MTLRWRPLAVALVAGAMALLLWRSQSAQALFDRRLIGAVLLAQVPLALAWGCIGWRLDVLLGDGHRRFRVALKGSLLAQGVDLVVPWKLSEFFKILYLHEQAGCALPVAFAATALERLMDVTLLALVSLAALTLVTVEADPTVYVVLAVAVPLSLWLFMRFFPQLRALVAWLPWPRLREFALRLIDDSSTRVRDGTLARALVPGVLTWLAAIAATWVYLVNALPAGRGADVDFSLALAVFWASAVGNLVSVLPAGFGTFETATALALLPAGIAFQDGLLIGLGLHFTQIMLGALGALVVAMTGPTGLRAALGRARDLARR